MKISSAREVRPKFRMRKAGNQEINSCLPGFLILSGLWRFMIGFGLKQFIHADELVAFGGEHIEQFAEAGVKLVLPARPTAEMEQQDEPVQAVWIFAFALQDTFEDGLRGNEIGVRLARVIRIRARARGEVDEVRPALPRPV